MPDLDIVPAWTCDTNISWEQEVESSQGGGSYTVRFGFRPSRRSDVLYDYSCTCRGFAFARSGYCKHIDKVKEQRCGWNGELEPTAEAARDANDEPCCPECGGPVTAMKVGV